MNTIRIATTKDIPLIRQMAEQVFPETYKHIITPAQCDYMMDMMYSEASLLRQMTKEGHVYQLLSVDGEPAGYVSVQPIEADVYELQKIYVFAPLPRPTFGTHALRRCGQLCQKAASQTMPHLSACQPLQQSQDVLRTPRIESYQAGRLRHRARLLHERLHHGEGSLKLNEPSKKCRLWLIEPSKKCRLWSFLSSKKCIFAGR